MKYDKRDVVSTGETVEGHHPANGSEWIGRRKPREYQRGVDFLILISVRTDEPIYICLNIHYILRENQQDFYCWHMLRSASSIIVELFLFCRLLS